MLVRIEPRIALFTLERGKSPTEQRTVTLDAEGDVPNQDGSVQKMCRDTTGTWYWIHTEADRETGTCSVVGVDEHQPLKTREGNEFYQRLTNKYNALL